MADLVREAMAMIEDMGEALSLSLDDSEEDEERERGDEDVSGLHEAPRSAGKREAPMRGDWDDERGSAKRRRGREATRTTTGSIPCLRRLVRYKWKTISVKTNQINDV